MPFVSINPASGDVINRFPDTAPDDVEHLMTRAHAAFDDWRCRSIEERGDAFRRAAAGLRANRDRYAEAITTEMGKPIAEARAEVEKCAWACEYFAGETASYLSDVSLPSTARESYVEYQPLGLILAIMPWNFPFWQVFRFAAPALMAGNGTIVKHSPNTPQSALCIAEVFDEAGFPAGLYTNLFVAPEVADDLLLDDRIAAGTLTGSTRAGSEVAASAGRAVKKMVLELGGSDPFIVLADANLDEAVAVGVRARFQNTGQSCIAAKRFLIEEAIADEFQQRFVAAVEALSIGNPLDPQTQIGPLAREDLRDNLVRQVEESVAMGAQVLTGGQALDRPGYYYAPTVLTDVRPGMPVFQEETFGPVAPLIRVRDADEAICLANETRYGLGSNLWTRDTDRAKDLARRIAAGNVFINGMTASDPRLPFGGIKKSGYGRELSAFGIHEFTNIQTVWIGPAQQPPSSE
ncbi:MAG TPA: NAD-dependent succinate-semialdehyde dehydrogenase [Chloroflexota bacterium]|nr:NAD-dependent succinate-semialdehyde dehydrogenase [Chloroflexota bacterium]